MLLSSLLALAVLSTPAATDQLRGSFDSVVPRLPGGYGTGRVALRVHAVPLPEASTPPLVGELISRTRMMITDAQGVRIEVVLPREVEFESIEARVVDGLVLEPQERSFLGRVGHAVVSLLRILLVGRLISATDDLAVSGAAWALALGVPDTEDELVRLSTSEALSIDRGESSFSDHGSFVVCRSMLAFSPWTELVDIQLRCRDRTTGRQVEFLIPRLPLHRNATPESPQEAQWRVVMATGP